MDRLSTLQLFVRVVDRGSFTQAGREEGLGQPAVSKQISALETRLGAPLLIRTSRGLHPTTAGQDLYETALRLLADYDEVEGRIGGGHTSPSGLVRVALPAALGRMYIIPRLADLFARHPGLSVELMISERHVSLVEDGIDIALRIGFLADSSLVARRIGSMATITVATPDYLERFGEPKTPDDLSAHRQVVFLFRGAPVGWRFEGSGGAFTREPVGAIRSNDAEHLRASVLAGLGIGHNARWLYAADLAAGRVRQILSGWAPSVHPIHAVTAGGRHMPARVRVFIDFLAEICAKEAALRI